MVAGRHIISEGSLVRHVIIYTSIGMYLETSVNCLRPLSNRRTQRSPLSPRTPIKSHNDRFSSLRYNVIRLLCKPDRSPCPDDLFWHKRCVSTTNVGNFVAYRPLSNIGQLGQNTDDIAHNRYTFSWYEFNSGYSYQCIAPMSNNSII